MWQKECMNIKNINFRLKQPSWKNYSIKYEFDNNSSKIIPHNQDPYIKAFLSDLILRPSCYFCQFKGLNTKSDITIGDFWGIEKVVPGFSDNNGASVVLVNTTKGIDFLKQCSKSIVLEAVSYKEIKQNALMHSAKMPIQRNAFLKKIKTKNLEDCIKETKGIITFSPIRIIKHNLDIQRKKTELNKPENLNNISNKQKESCCGCEACYQKCPTNAITMELDENGFYYPRVDNSKCIGCRQCLIVCPTYKKKKDTVQNRIAYAGKITDDKIRLISSSGGIFSAFANYILDNNGIVYGAIFDRDENDFLFVRHCGISNHIELHLIRGSKYVQSRIFNVYNEAKQQLDCGKQVMFTGTPCQIAGLKTFLNKEYENLITVEVICHGTPAPGIFKKYLNEIIEKNH